MKRLHFTPRLNKEGIYNSRYWYTDNPFYTAGYGLPNCTCYAWGRWYEITGNAPSLPLGDGGTWFDDAKASGLPVGKTPKLGAIACFGKTGGAGHVCVVEEIHADGTITTSNSGYNRPIAPYPPDTRSYFFTSHHNKNNIAPWMNGNYYFQGFIYLENTPDPPIPSHPVHRKSFPIMFYLRRR